MRFFQVVLSGAALINAAMAAISFTKVPTSVQAGQSVEIEWQTDATGPVTILLRKGPADNLGAGQTITATGANGKFTWAVPSNLVNGNDYAFEIKQGSENNFSGQFSLSGGTGQASSSAAASSSAPASSSAASSVSASVTVTSAASSVSGTPSASSNGTVTSATLTRSTSGTSRPTGSSTSTGGVPESTGAASTLITSPLALIFGAVAAMAYLN